MAKLNSMYAGLRIWATRITIMSGAEVGNADVNRMSITVPAWLLKEIVYSNGKSRLECANIEE
ncbi:hypothetical protein SPSIL_055790 [Sporomusa silvacetica DSM 10669]|uniref:Uncharacterized protein n=1 Tax=Sporomusa silvacetica DSM 10669 TaxID=1123289 RepID=A0ABZ3IUZ9_9FIRM|nr:hypothetical protein [Sporomusa silvacetica]OZC23899.1 hypothetical protein SPSIL_00600 [Sporomusa silvacetica DSM 10669]